MDEILETLIRLADPCLAPLDLLPQPTPAEKVIALVVDGPPAGVGGELARGFARLGEAIHGLDLEGVRVAVIGGGTGLSNVVGGDSRRRDWRLSPFRGLKELFPRTSSVVCVTDDGGSSGELLKHLPLVALGDLRHVLLSSVSRTRLRVRHGLDEAGALRCAAALHDLFNFRYDQAPHSPSELLAASGARLEQAPEEIAVAVQALLEALFLDPRLKSTLGYPHCVGNLLLAGAIYSHLPSGLETPSPAALGAATMAGLAELADLLGAAPEAVLPCATTPAQLRVLYSNGVAVTGEHKSGHARRDFPVDRVFVDFAGEPALPDELIHRLQQADIIVMAPGSLYSSIIPVLQVPGIAGAIRANRRALKLLIANLWVQNGETDVSREAPDRRFYVSDLIHAYNRNIPGGVRGLFSSVLTLGLDDIPGSVLRSYRMEQKEPIFLDRDRVNALGLAAIEAPICSQSLLRGQGMIQHDPCSLALTIKTLWALHREGWLPGEADRATPVPGEAVLTPLKNLPLPRDRFQSIVDRVRAWTYTEVNGQEPLALGAEAREALQQRIIKVVWEHKDVKLSHLDNVRGVMLVSPESWGRSQQWDNVLSFYDPADCLIKVRRDAAARPERFEMVFLVALGQALLGNYCLEKWMEEVLVQGEAIGRAFHLTLRPAGEGNCLFDRPQLDRYLRLTRIHPHATAQDSYVRLVNRDEGFTPPGLLFGLLYAWYLDNRFAIHVEYKMAIMRMPASDLIPEQVRIADRRSRLIAFLRETVFLPTGAP